MYHSVFGPAKHEEVESISVDYKYCSPSFTLSVVCDANKNRKEKMEKMAARSPATIIFLTFFFHVKHNRLSERGTTRSLEFPRQ